MTPFFSSSWFHDKKSSFHLSTSSNLIRWTVRGFELAIRVFSEEKKSIKCEYHLKFDSVQPSWYLKTEKWIFSDYWPYFQFLTMQVEWNRRQKASTESFTAFCSANLSDSILGFRFCRKALCACMSLTERAVYLPLNLRTIFIPNINVFVAWDEDKRINGI